MGDVVLGRVIVFPLDVDQALLVVVLGPQVHTVLTVNGNPTSFGNVTDNCISWDGIATLSNPDQETRSPLDDHATFMADLEGVFFVFNLDFATFDQLFSFCTRLGLFLFSTLFLRQTIKDRDGSDFSKTDGRKQGIFGLVAGLLQDLVHVLLIHELVGNHIMLMELGHEQLSSTVDREFLVLVLKELADLIAGLAGLDDIEPVTTWSK